MADLFQLLFNKNFACSRLPKRGSTQRKERNQDLPSFPTFLPFGLPRGSRFFPTIHKFKPPSHHRLDAVEKIMRRYPGFTRSSGCTGVPTAPTRSHRSPTGHIRSSLISQCLEPSTLVRILFESALQVPVNPQAGQSAQRPGAETSGDLPHLWA